VGAAVELLRCLGAWQDAEKRWRGSQGKAKAGEKAQFTVVQMSILSLLSTQQWQRSQFFNNPPIP